MASTALIQESQQLALDLFQIIDELDPANWRERFVAQARERLDDILSRLQALREKLEHAEVMLGVGVCLTSLEGVLRAQPEAGEGEASTELRDHWMQFLQKVQPAYESLAQALRTEAVHVPSLRPTNHARKSVHVLSALGIVGIIMVLPEPIYMSGLSGVAALFGWFLETLRRVKPSMNGPIMRLFGPIAHPHEYHRINSATWYTTALFLISLSGSPMLCVIAVLALGFGDPMAAMIGRRWGRIKLVNGRSLEGTLAFFFIGGVSTLALTSVLFPLIELGRLSAIVGVAMLVSAVAELFSRRVDDNLSIPVAAVLGGLLMQTLIG